MYGRFYAQKLHYFGSRYHKLLFRDIKLSDLGHRNRKLSAHFCTEHIKTPFFSDNYHETRNINMSEPAVLLVPGHNRGYMGTV